MISKYFIRIFLVLICSISWTTVSAQNILTVRSAQDFEQAISSLQIGIETHGYKVTHVQRCDAGLKSLGYGTDRYRVVFFGKLAEVRHLSKTYPQLIPFLPLKIAVFAEGEQTIISALNPASLGKFYAGAELGIQFKSWEKDPRSILTGMQQSGAKLATGTFITSADAD